LTEIQKDSLMKITEPKTPYVRYNPETDEVEGGMSWTMLLTDAYLTRWNVEEIPSLDLDKHGGPSSQPTSPVLMQSPSASIKEIPDVPSRRSSIASLGRSSSGRSSRSTSFNLPKDATKEIRATGGETGEIDLEEMDPEGISRTAQLAQSPPLMMDLKAAAKHEEFVKARKGHYSNEAEAMKVNFVSVSSCVSCRLLNQTYSLRRD
jgi:protein phosphatase inhibitor 2